MHVDTKVFALQADRAISRDAGVDKAKDRYRGGRSFLQPIALCGGAGKQRLHQQLLHPVLRRLAELQRQHLHRLSHDYT